MWLQVLSVHVFDFGRIQIILMKPCGSWTVHMNACDQACSFSQLMVVLC